MANVQNIPASEKLRDSNQKINDNFNNINTQLEGHVNNTSNRHKTSNIDNDSLVIGSTAKDALNTLSGRIDNIVSGDSNAEIGIYSVQATGTNTLTATYLGIQSYFGGLKLNVTIENTNTGPVTLDLNGLGAKAIKKINFNGEKEDLERGDLHAGQIVQLQYDGTDWIYLGGVTADYSTPTEETAEVIHLPSNTVKGQISGSVKGRTYTNLLGNDGDFEVDSDANGLADGWGYRASNAVALDTDSIFGNKSQKMTSCNDGSIVFSNYLHHKINFNVDDKIYISLYAKYSTLDYNPKIQMLLRDGLFGSSLSSISSFTVSNANYTKYSTILQATAIGDNQGILIRDGHNATTTSFDRWIDGVLAVNLTQLFGAGNEPTLEECDQMFHFINGTKSTLNTRLRSVGKNLFDKWTVEQGNFSSAYGKIYPDDLIGGSNRVRSKLIRVKPNTSYTISGSTELNYYIDVFDEYYMMIQSCGSWRTSGYTITTLSNAKYILVIIKYSDDRNFTPVNILDANIQLEQGNTATEYEPYKESVVYLDETFRSLPNGISDEVDVDEGKLIQRTKEYVLQSEHFASLYTSLTNVDMVRIYKPVDSSFYNKISNSLGQLILGDYIEDNITTSNWDDTSNIGKFTVNVDGLYIDLFVAKGTYASLAAAQADLAGTTLIYQLAEPQVIELDNVQPLQCFENGTLYVEQTVRDSGIYSGGLSVSNANLPIDSLEAVYKVDGDTKTSVDLSDCTVATNGLSFTITGAIDGEKYEFIYSYPSELGTIPSIKYSVPLNRAAQIDDNTAMINQLSKELGDLWTTLLPLADKELAMFAIADITTDMSTDVFANELKNKINEILSIW